MLRRKASVTKPLSSTPTIPTMYIYIQLHPNETLEKYENIHLDMHVKLGKENKSNHATCHSLRSRKMVGLRLQANVAALASRRGGRARQHRRAQRRRLRLASVAALSSGRGSGERKQTRLQRADAAPAGERTRLRRARRHRRADAAPASECGGAVERLRPASVAALVSARESS